MVFFNFDEEDQQNTDGKPREYKKFPENTWIKCQIQATESTADGGKRQGQMTWEITFHALGSEYNKMRAWKNYYPEALGWTLKPLFISCGINTEGEAEITIADLNNKFVEIQVQYETGRKYPNVTQIRAVQPAF